MILVYVTCPSQSEAERIGKTLVESRLAACAHVLPAGKSFFWWKGKLEKTNESVLLLKIRDANYDKVEKTILKMHSHGVPCIIAFKPVRVFKKFEAWSDRASKKAF